MNKMKKLGAPTIKYTYVEAYGNVALEGTHRLEAAYRLKKIPIFDKVEHTELIGHDVDWIDNPIMAADFVYYFGRPEGKFYDFEETEEMNL